MESQLCKCPNCDYVLDVRDAKKVNEDDIVTCMDEDDKTLYECCWKCTLKPTNSKLCLKFMEHEKAKHPKFRQFKAKEMFE